VEISFWRVTIQFVPFLNLSKKGGYSILQDGTWIKSPTGLSDLAIESSTRITANIRRCVGIEIIAANVTIKDIRAQVTCK
jgi:hypothetical protein